MKNITIRLLFILLIISSCTKKTSNEFEKNTYSTISNKTFTLTEIKEFEGVFIIISTNCSSCYSFFELANQILNNGNKEIKYVALVIDPLSSIQEYKKGFMYKNFGFLNDNWIIIPSKELPELINQDYNLEKHGTPYIFYRKNNTNINLNNIHSKIELINQIKSLNKNEKTFFY